MWNAFSPTGLHARLDLVVILAKPCGAPAIIGSLHHEGEHAALPLAVDALLPAFVCEPAVTSRALVPSLRASVTESVPVFLAHPEGRHLPTRVRLLYDFLVERLEL